MTEVKIRNPSPNPSSGHSQGGTSSPIVANATKIGLKKSIDTSKPAATSSNTTASKVATVVAPTVISIPPPMQVTPAADPVPALKVEEPDEFVIPPKVITKAPEVKKPEVAVKPVAAA